MPKNYVHPAKTPARLPFDEPPYRPDHADAAAAGMRLKGGSALFKKTTNRLAPTFPHIKFTTTGRNITPTEKIPTIEELDYWLSPLSTEQEALEFLRRQNLLADEQDPE